MFYLDQLRIRKLKVFSLPPYIFSSLVFFSLCRFEFLTHVTFLCLENLEHFLQDRSVYLAPGAYVSSKSWISAVTLNSPSSSNFGILPCELNSLASPRQVFDSQCIQHFCSCKDRCNKFQTHYMLELKQEVHAIAF